MAGTIFINYRRGASLGSAQHLATLLAKPFGRRNVFLDVKGIDGADNWLHTLERQVAKSDAMLALIGPGWADLTDKAGNRRLDNPNDFVRYEISQAWQRDVPVLPILLGGAEMPDPGKLPQSLLVLTLLQAMPLRDESFETDADAIIRRLRVLLAKRRRRGLPAWAAGLATATALAGGVVAGPFAFGKLGLTPPWVTDPNTGQLLVQITDLKVAVGRAERDARDQGVIAARLPEVERERDAARDAARADAAKAIDDLRSAEARRVRELAEQKTALETEAGVARKAATDRLAAIIKDRERERDEARATATRDRDEAWAAAKGAVGKTEADAKRIADLVAAEKRERDARQQAERELAALRKADAAVEQPQPVPARPVEIGQSAQPFFSGLSPLGRRGSANRSDPVAALVPGSGSSAKDCAECPEMVVVPDGSFLMGSPASEDGRGADEDPQRRVTFAKPFAVGKFAVTFAEWDACVAGGGCSGYKPSDQGWGRLNRPVINVSWDDAKAYTTWLSGKTGHTYRLLSEAEREYVARAGTSTPFWWGASITPAQANYDGNYTYGGGAKGEYRQRSVPVDSFQPNPWGLYQVHGNVWEWTEDCYASYSGAPTDGSAIRSDGCVSRVLRGGSWGYGPQYLRSALRNGNRPGGRSDYTGFRVARTFTPKFETPAQGRDETFRPPFFISPPREDLQRPGPRNL